LTCNERRDAIFLLEADQLDGTERAEVRAHLERGCPRCLGAFAEARAAHASLALELDPIEPSPSVRERLLARITVPNVVSLAPRTSVRPEWRRMALAAGVAGLVAFGTGRLTTQSSDTNLARDLAIARRELTRLASESDQSRAVLGVLASPDVSLVDLSGGALGYRGAARMYWDYESRGCYLRATEMRKPEPGEGYVLWFTAMSGAPLRGGVIEVNENGVATLLTEMPAGIDPTAPVYVTLEKNPSAVAAPTAEPVLQDLLDQT
jgi:hypothetical protein